MRNINLCDNENSHHIAHGVSTQCCHLRRNFSNFLRCAKHKFLEMRGAWVFWRCAKQQLFGDAQSLNFSHLNQLVNIVRLLVSVCPGHQHHFAIGAEVHIKFQLFLVLQKEVTNIDNFDLRTVSKTLKKFAGPQKMDENPWRYWSKGRCLLRWWRSSGTPSYCLGPFPRSEKSSHCLAF